MTNRYLSIFTIFLFLFPTGSSYRFVDPFPASDYALVSVRNATVETGLATILEEEIRRKGGFKERSSNRVSVTVTDFTETVESVSSGGVPVRQKLAMTISWKVEGTQSAQAAFGKKIVVQSYPYSTDLSTLDWNRNAAVRLLSETAARSLLEQLGEKP
jgi:hypothetical protein